jgi:hypothetical protein
MYELIHKGNHPLAYSNYQKWLEPHELKTFCFQSRIFVEFREKRLAAMQADLTSFWNAGNHYLPDGHFVPALWLADLIRISQDNPLTQHQLEFALKHQISVEGFACNIAVAFYNEWARDKNLPPND